MSSRPDGSPGAGTRQAVREARGERRRADRERRRARTLLETANRLLSPSPEGQDAGEETAVRLRTAFARFADPERTGRDRRSELSYLTTPLFEDDEGATARTAFEAVRSSNGVSEETWAFLDAFEAYVGGEEWEPVPEALATAAGEASLAGELTLVFETTVEAARRSLEAADHRLNRVEKPAYLDAVDEPLEALSGQPIALLPVQLQTRFVGPHNSPEATSTSLKIRVVHDQIHVDSHETALTDEEVRWGENFWTNLWVASHPVFDDRLRQPDGEYLTERLSESRHRRVCADVDPESYSEDSTARYTEIRDRSWGQLVERFGRERAAWVVHAMAPSNPAEWDEQTSFGDALLAPPSSGGSRRRRGFQSQPALDFPDPERRPDSWSTAATARLLPDRWVAILHWETGGGTERRSVVEGPPVREPLTAGPDPESVLGDESGDGDDEGTDEPTTPAGMEWLVDFDAARDVGMGLSVDLSTLGGFDPSRGFTRVVVVGVRSSMSATESSAELRALLDAHHYTDGLSFLQQGEATNVHDGDSVYSSSRPLSETAAVECGPPLTGTMDFTDGDILARALGVDPAPGQPHVFAHVENAGAQTQRQSRHMNSALWPSTIGYFLQNLLVPNAWTSDESIRSGGRDELSAAERRQRTDEGLLWVDAYRRHFIRYVRGRGPFPVLRTGRQPYGILPVASVLEEDDGISLGPHVRIDDALAAGYSIEDLLAVDVPLSRLYRADVPVVDLLAAGAAVEEFEAAGIEPNPLVEANVPVGDLMSAGYEVAELRAAGVGVRSLASAGVPATELRRVGFTPVELGRAGVSASAVVGAGYPGDRLLDAGYTVSELASAGFSTAGLVGAGATPTELRLAGVPAGDLRAAGVSARRLRAAGFDASSLRNAGFGVPTLVDAGFPPSALRDADASVRDLRSAGVPAADLRRDGFSAADLSRGGFSAADLREAGFSAGDLRAAGFDAADLRASGFGVDALRTAGFGARSLRDAGFGAAGLRAAGVSADELREAGFDARSLRTAGFGARELLDAGYGVPTLVDADVPVAAIRRNGGSLAALREAGVDAGDLRSTGASARELDAAGFSVGDIESAGFDAAELERAGLATRRGSTIGRYGTVTTTDPRRAERDIYRSRFDPVVPTDVGRLAESEDDGGDRFGRIFFDGASTAVTLTQPRKIDDRVSENLRGYLSAFGGLWEEGLTSHPAADESAASRETLVDLLQRQAVSNDLLRQGHLAWHGALPPSQSVENRHERTVAATRALLDDPGFQQLDPRLAHLLFEDRTEEEVGRDDLVDSGVRGFVDALVSEPPETVRKMAYVMDAEELDLDLASLRDSLVEAKAEYDERKKRRERRSNSRESPERFGAVTREYELELELEEQPYLESYYELVEGVTRDEVTADAAEQIVQAALSAEGLSSEEIESFVSSANAESTADYQKLLLIVALNAKYDDDPALLKSLVRLLFHQGMLREYVDGRVRLGALYDDHYTGGPDPAVYDIDTDSVFTELFDRPVPDALQAHPDIDSDDKYADALFTAVQRYASTTSIDPRISEYVDSVSYLAQLEPRELRRHLLESLDVASHRFDAWWTSLATKRLFELRESQGAWMEHRARSTDLWTPEGESGGGGGVSVLDPQGTPLATGVGTLGGEFETGVVFAHDNPPVFSEFVESVDIDTSTSINAVETTVGERVTFGGVTTAPGTAHAGHVFEFEGEGVEIDEEVLERLSERGPIGRPAGVYVGGYAVVEDLSMDEATERPEYLHAPSLQQATTGAILRGAHQSAVESADGRDAEAAAALEVDLSPARVRTAKRLISGVRNGIGLSELLGYRFERALHEETIAALSSDGDVNLVRYKDAFRRQFPAVVGKLAHRGDDEERIERTASELAKSDVVDGYGLYRNWDEFPFGEAELAGVSGAERGLLDDVVADIGAALDAVSDLFLAETVHQLGQGNFSRAAGSVDALARGEAFDTPTVTDIPRTERGVTHRMLVLLGEDGAEGDGTWTTPTTAPTFESGDGPAVSDAPLQPRAAAEPTLGGWVAERLPAAADVECLATYHWTETGADDEPEEREHARRLTLADLELTALDALALQAEDDAAASELEQRAEYHLRRTVPDDPDIPDDAVLSLSFRETETPGAISVATFLELVRSLRDVVTDSRALAPNDLSFPSTAVDVDAAYAGHEAELADRADAAQDALATVADSLADRLRLVRTDSTVTAPAETTESAESAESAEPATTRLVDELDAAVKEFVAAAPLEALAEALDLVAAADADLFEELEAVRDALPPGAPTAGATDDVVVEPAGGQRIRGRLDHPPVPDDEGLDVDSIVTVLDEVGLAPGTVLSLLGEDASDDGGTTEDESDELVAASASMATLEGHLLTLNERDDAPRLAERLWSASFAEDEAEAEEDGRTRAVRAELARVLSGEREVATFLGGVEFGTVRPAPGETEPEPEPEPAELELHVWSTSPLVWFERSATVEVRRRSFTAELDFEDVPAGTPFAVAGVVDGEIRFSTVGRVVVDANGGEPGGTSPAEVMDDLTLVPRLLRLARLRESFIFRGEEGDDPSAASRLYDALDALQPHWGTIERERERFEADAVRVDGDDLAAVDALLALDELVTSDGGVLREFEDALRAVTDLLDDSGLTTAFDVTGDPSEDAGRAVWFNEGRAAEAKLRLTRFAAHPDRDESEAARRYADDTAARFEDEREPAYLAGFLDAPPWAHRYLSTELDDAATALRTLTRLAYHPETFSESDREDAEDTLERVADAVENLAGLGDLFERLESGGLFTGDPPDEDRVAVERFAEILRDLADSEPNDLGNPNVARTEARSDLREAVDEVDTALATVDERVGAVADRSAAAAFRAGVLETVRLTLLRASYFGVYGAIPVPATGRDVADENAMAEQLAAVAGRVDARAESARALDPRTDGVPEAPSPTQAVETHESRLNAVFGPAFDVVPRFSPGNAETLGATFDDPSLVDGAEPLAVDTWFQRNARIKERLATFRDARTYPELVTGHLAPDLTVGQLPHDPTGETRWAGVAVPDPGTVSLVAQFDSGAAPDALDAGVAGLFVDEWVEKVPADTETTGIAVNYDDTGVRPPQSVLLAIPSGDEWTLGDLESVIDETLHLAKLRALDLGDLPPMGALLPMLAFPFNDAERPMTPSVDFDMLDRYDPVLLQVLHPVFALTQVYTVADADGGEDGE